MHTQLMCVLEPVQAQAHHQRGQKQKLACVGGKWRAYSYSAPLIAGCAYLVRLAFIVGVGVRLRIQALPLLLLTLVLIQDLLLPRTYMSAGVCALVCARVSVSACVLAGGLQPQLPLPAIRQAH